MKTQVIQFSQKGDDRGSLIVIENRKEVPFDIHRVFYMVNTTMNVTRGQHANRLSDFVLVNIKGSVKILTDDGNQKEHFVLDQPHIGVYIPKMVWKEMFDFSEDSVLLVLSNLPYQEHEYIRDYSQFIKELEV